MVYGGISIDFYTCVQAGVFEVESFSVYEPSPVTNEEDAIKKAILAVVQVWVDRLQSVAIVTTFFTSIESLLFSLVSSTHPTDVHAWATTDKLMNASLGGALIFHVCASIVAYTGSFVLIRYRLDDATKNESSVESKPSFSVRATEKLRTMDTRRPSGSLDATLAPHSPIPSPLDFVETLTDLRGLITVHQVHPSASSRAPSARRRQSMTDVIVEVERTDAVSNSESEAKQGQTMVGLSKMRRSPTFNLSADDAAEEEPRDETTNRHLRPLDITVIEDLGSITYPEGIKRPKVELNINAKRGKFRYDREFLLQFMTICMGKPDSLPPLDALSLVPVVKSSMILGGSGRRTSSTSMPPPASTAGHQASIGLSISGRSKSVNPFNPTGQFSALNNNMTSEGRYQMSNRSTLKSDGPAVVSFDRPSSMVCSSGQSGPDSHPIGSGQARTKRGRRGHKDHKADAGSSGQSFLASLGSVVPLQVSANRWRARSLCNDSQATDTRTPEVVHRKVLGLLNKLTMERFESISDQIIAWANKSGKEKDGRTLIQVIGLISEKATDEAMWSEMYARLCRKMMERLSENVQDDGVRNFEGKPIAGGQLFHKYLLNRCQEDFKRGWGSRKVTYAIAEIETIEVRAAKDGEETLLYSDEYYAAHKVKRRGFGLIKFNGELFKQQILTERVMHDLAKYFLADVETPRSEDVESLCKLLTTVGQMLDTPKSRAHMSVYFSRMKKLCKSRDVNSRMRFMLQDVIELRERKWVPRNQVVGPTTIAAIHEAAAKEKAANEMDAYQRTLKMPSGSSRRDAKQGEYAQTGPHSWATIGSSAPRPPPKAGDLSDFGKINKTALMTFGPRSTFAGKETKRESPGSMNMFTMLGQNPELAAESPLSKSIQSPNRKASLTLSQSGVPEVPTRRRKVNLLSQRVFQSDETQADATPAVSRSIRMTNIRTSAPMESVRCSFCVKLL
ncbi:Eukaryotic translation initiation factor 4 gamma [Grifola frondosa]|uniref:Eukaryotic translation initiation factor 4 gamma n=1 Tax=Grifola frondosa TaxID=5627 RepID=A0A1C7LYR5_GRIFR|nr:Eukaryotic translation initiation factor 4 gamma [Grifola frondosa]